MISRPRRGRIGTEIPPLMVGSNRVGTILKGKIKVVSNKTDSRKWAVMKSGKISPEGPGIPRRRSTWISVPACRNLMISSQTDHFGSKKRRICSDLGSETGGRTTATPGPQNIPHIPHLNKIGTTFHNDNHQSPIPNTSKLKIWTPLVGLYMTPLPGPNWSSRDYRRKIMIKGKTRSWITSCRTPIPD